MPGVACARARLDVRCKRDTQNKLRVVVVALQRRAGAHAALVPRTEHARRCVRVFGVQARHARVVHKAVQRRLAAARRFAVMVVAAARHPRRARLRGSARVATALSARCCWSCPATCAAAPAAAARVARTGARVAAGRAPPRARIRCSFDSSSSAAATALLSLVSTARRVCTGNRCLQHDVGAACAARTAAARVLGCRTACSAASPAAPPTLTIVTPVTGHRCVSPACQTHATRAVA